MLNIELLVKKAFRSGSRLGGGYPNTGSIILLTDNKLLHCSQIAVVLLIYIKYSKYELLSFRVYFH